MPPKKSSKPHNDPASAGKSADKPVPGKEIPLPAKDALVAILDDDESVLKGLRTLFMDEGYEVADFSKPEDLLAFRLPARPCCLILDQELNDPCNGLDVHSRIKDLKWHATTVFLSAHWDVSTVVKAVRNGAEEFITKPFEPARLLEAVAAAVESSRQRLASSDVSETLRARAAHLSTRERQIVRLVASGMLNKEIADQLGLALVTVKVHRGRAMQKLGAGNAAELSLIASQCGILD